MSKQEIKNTIKKLEARLQKLKAKKEGSSPEARSIRKELRDLGHYVSKNDTREGKPKKKKLALKPAKKASSKKKKPVDRDEEEDE